MSVYKNKLHITNIRHKYKSIISFVQFIFINLYDSNVNNESYKFNFTKVNHL